MVLLLVPPIGPSQVEIGLPFHDEKMGSGVDPWWPKPRSSALGFLLWLIATVL